MFLLLRAFIAVAAGDGIADEFDLSAGVGGARDKATTLVEYETPELRVELITLNSVHQTDEVTAFRQCGSECNH